MPPISEMRGWMAITVCAQANVAQEAANLGKMLASLGKMIGILHLFLGMLGLPEVPSLSSVAGQPLDAVIEPIDELIRLFEAVRNAVPPAMSLTLRNLLVPFCRDKKRDFAVGTAEALLASKVRQALLTEGDTPRASGELPWRTAFGGALALLRHRNNDSTLKELARVCVENALQRWVPGARLDRLDIEQDAGRSTLRLHVSESSVVVDVTLL